MRPSTALLIAALLLLLGAAGCGGGDSDDSSNSDEPFPTSASTSNTKKTYINQADAACFEFNRRVRSLPQPKDPKEVAKLYRKIAAEAQKFYDSFKGIPKPPGNQPLLTQYEKNLAQSIAITKKAAEAIQDNKTKVVGRYFAAARRLQRQDRSIAKRYGFKVCGGQTASG